MFSACRSFGLAAALAWLVALPAAAGTRVLRVAADPNNLPFSNERGEGFENRLAGMLARDLGARLEYMWWPQRRGFFRETIGAGRADLVMGVPAGFERVRTTRPYYHSSYVAVVPGEAAEIRSVDDPRLRTMTIGVQLAGDDGINTPPAHALSRRGHIANVRGYTLFGDYAEASPPSAIIRAVATGEVEVAFAWGPMAGYFARRQPVPLRIAPLDPCDCPDLQFTFGIAIGVARGQPELATEVDAFLERRREDIARLLTEFGAPQVPAPQPTGPAHVSNE